MAPSPARRTSAVASYGGTKLSRMREPQVVRMPRVQSTSLIASGTPSSGRSGSPRRNRSSARSAWARAVAAVTVRYAPSVSLNRAMRSRYPSTSARAVTRPSRRAFTVSWMVSPVQSVTGSLLQDARHPELPVLLVGGVLEHGVRRIGRPDLVVPHHVDEREDMRGGLDAGRVHPAQLLDVAEDLVELAPHPLLLVSVEGEPGEARDVLDLGQRDLRVAHRVLSWSAWESPGRGAAETPAQRIRAGPGLGTSHLGARPAGARRCRVYTSSSGAYLRRRRFRPTAAKFTVTTTSSPSFWMPVRIPSPQSACRTRAPTRSGYSSAGSESGSRAGSETRPGQAAGRPGRTSLRRPPTSVTASLGISRRKRDGSRRPAYPPSRRSAA